MKNQKGNALLGLLVIVTVIAAVVGYIWNIVKLFGIEKIDGNMGEVVIRIIGIFTGIVGAIAGYF